MESLGKLKDDFLLRKFEEATSETDLYTGLDKYASSSQTDLSGEVGMCSLPRVLLQCWYTLL